MNVLVDNHVVDGRAWHAYLSSVLLIQVPAGRMQYIRHVLRTDEDSEEANRNRAIVAAAVPMSSRLQECLASLEFVARSVGGEFDGQRALHYVDVGRRWMGHPLSDRTRRYC